MRKARAGLKTMPTEEINQKLLNAIEHFSKGWSLSTAMSKAGFPANWTLRPDIYRHDILEKMREVNEERRRAKRMFKLHV